MKTRWQTRSIAAALALAALAAAPGARATQGITETQVIVGTHQDLSGPITSWGVPVRNGLQMAFDHVNAEGGVHGRELVLKVEDTGYDPRRAVLAAQKLINRDKVFAILGGLGTPTSVAIMPLALRKGIPHLFPVTAAVQTYNPFHKLKFSLITPYYHGMRVGLDKMLRQTGLKRVGILYQDDEYGLNVKRGVEDELAAHGLSLVSETTYKRGATDLNTQIARLRADGVELVVLGSVTRETVGAVQAAQALGWDPVFLGSTAIFTTEVPRLGGDAVEGLYAVSQFDPPYADSPDPLVRAWVREYEDRFDLQASSQAVTGYVTGRLFAAGLEAAGPNPTVDTYVKALEDMPPWTPAIVGGVPLDFTEQDHLGSRAAFLGQIRNGRWERISDDLFLDRELEPK